MAGIPFFNRRPAWMQGAGALTTRWLESTMEIARWENMRKAGRRWGWWGAGLGLVAGLVVYAPASWLAQAIVDLTAQRVLLAESQGTIWHGDAVVVLTGGPGSRDARALPGRLNWTMRPHGLGLKLTFQQDCCIPTPAMLLVQFGMGRIKAEVQLQPAAGGNAAAAPVPAQAAGEIGHWPAAWLSGLGTPWNTLQLGGVLRLSSRDLAFEWAQGRLHMQGQAEITLENMSSRMVTLDRLGSYRLDMGGDAQGQLQLQLSTLDGALQLTGQGGTNGGRLRFRGEARASDAERGALENILNIIGRREGDRSVFSIG